MNRLISRLSSNQSNSIYRSLRQPYNVTAAFATMLNSNRCVSLPTTSATGATKLSRRMESPMSIHLSTNAFSAARVQTFRRDIESAIRRACEASDLDWLQLMKKQCDRGRYSANEGLTGQKIGPLRDREKAMTEFAKYISNVQPRTEEVSETYDILA